jgi:signal transduction histidine kinase
VENGRSTDNVEFEKQTAVAVVHSTSLDLGATLKNYQNETHRAQFIRAYIDPIRFFLDGYFYVYDLVCVNIAHATQKDLQGQNLYNYQDSNGNYEIRC